MFGVGVGGPYHIGDYFNVDIKVRKHLYKLSCRSALKSTPQSPLQALMPFSVEDPASVILLVHQPDGAMD